MDAHELEKWLNDLESDRVERKASIADGKKIRQAICAFANDLPNSNQPGILFIGVNDDGTCANLPITDDLLLSLSSIRNEGKILPFPVLQVKKYHLKGCDLAVIIVEPSDAPPVRFEGRTWIRVGPRRAIATQEEERRLTEKRRFRDLPFDLQPLVSASLEDLNLETFTQDYLQVAIALDILEENQRSITQQLVSLRFATPEPSLSPTRLGVMVVGKDPRQFIPSFYLQFIRFDGMDLTDPIQDQQEITGSLMSLLRNIDQTLKVNISIASDPITEPVEIKKPDYPIAALRQLVSNAILHRSYEATNAPIKVYWFKDRIEISNPGGLFGQVNRENLGQGVTDYRNPHLAEAMKNLGYVQRFGIGIPTARQELAKNGNPPPEFILDDAHTLVIVRSSL
ncbi:ATP-binding protein [Spirulina subsalsa]|uniref:ATP-binding protein n=1 Tax=Spirulina subsalsa TaxID=54311 RepID=UPI0002E02878|nr:ATP-binding protein [Spirulina subsalsa]